MHSSPRKSCGGGQQGPIKAWEVLWLPSRLTIGSWLCCVGCCYHHFLLV